MRALITYAPIFIKVYKMLNYAESGVSEKKEDEWSYRL